MSALSTFTDACREVAAMPALGPSELWHVLARVREMLPSFDIEPASRADLDFDLGRQIDDLQEQARKPEPDEVPLHQFLELSFPERFRHAEGAV